ncbi:hypothetical protein Cni_G06673 [Canna indica]|uniref:Reverse transcriptase n=1 Tax=Canna indica TaxID=4628 RepID=A0AAQ3Q475_9LILI|nr:hypothetical protein Cni_G06673 [Canna indica]
MGAHAQHYFEDLFTSGSPLDPSTRLADLQSKVSNTMNRKLTRPVTESEVKYAVFSIDPGAAPSDDDFTARFYQRFWDIIASDVCKVARSFFSDQLEDFVKEIIYPPTFSYFVRRAYHTYFLRENNPIQSRG